MALQLKGDAEIECDLESFDYTETTGLYNATDNTGGYGAPNAALASLTSPTMTLSNLTTLVEYDPIVWIPASTEVVTSIPVANIKLDTVAIAEIVDGLWEFKYEALVGATTYTGETRILVLAGIRCSMTEIAKKIADDSCGCCNNPNFLKYAQEVSLLYNVLLLSPICGDTTKINNQIQELQDLLEDINCNC